MYLSLSLSLFFDGRTVGLQRVGVGVGLGVGVGMRMRMGLGLGVGREWVLMRHRLVGRSSKVQWELVREESKRSESSEERERGRTNRMGVENSGGFLVAL